MRYAILSHDGMIVQCELHEWSAWFEKSTNRLIAQYKRLGFRVSTIFMGLNHNFSPTGPAIWFETILFGPLYEVIISDGRTALISDQLASRRYSTLEEAKAGHEAIRLWLVERLDLSRDYQLALTDKETNNESVINRSFPAEDPPAGYQ